MINFEKLRLVETELGNALDVRDNKETNLRKIAKHTGIFEYLQQENGDDWFEFSINGIKFQKCQEEYLECNCSNEFIDINIKDRFEMELENLEDDLETELTSEQRTKINRLLLIVEANLIARMEEKLNEYYMDLIDKNIKAIEDKVDGFKYDYWEETDIHVTIDNEGYTYSLYGELYDKENSMTISELENKERGN